MSDVVRAVILCDPDATAIETARAALSADAGFRVAATTATFPELIETVVRAGADVVVLDAGAVREIPSAVRELLAAAPECCVVVTGVDIPPAVVSRAVTAGARGFLLKPYPPSELVRTASEAFQSLVALRRVQRPQPASAPTPTGPPRGKLIVAYGPKGGVGTTTIATNLAIALANPKRRVAVVDLDLQFGDVGCLLDLRGVNSVIDLLEHVNGIDASVLAEIMPKHSSGIQALLAPEGHSELAAISADQISWLMDQLRNHFDYIVCDLWSSLDELTLAMLRLADRVILVTTPELPALKNLRRAITATGNLLLDDRTIVVVNRLPGKVGINVADIERNVGKPIAVGIPSDGVGVTDAINHGISVFDHRAHVRITRAYRRLANLLSGDVPYRRGAEVGPVPAAASAQ
ncbi:MAG: AAA family ATPase [Actinomycetota bacterium]|nr:AAA family ATPase [Actinomycetota bacterium]